MEYHIFCAQGNLCAHMSVTDLLVYGIYCIAYIIYHLAEETMEIYINWVFFNIIFLIFHQDFILNDYSLVI